MDVLLFRAGALGDLLLLRPTIAALRAAGCDGVQLLAPELPGGVLRGPGAADSVLPCDGLEVAAALAEGWRDGPVAQALEAVDAVVAYTRSAPLVERLAERARRLILHDPAPPASTGHAGLWLAQAVTPLLDSAPAPRLADVPVLSFTDSELDEAAHRTRPLPPGFLAIHPGSGSPSKNWPTHRFCEAASRLAGEHPWLLVAGPAEAGIAAPRGAILAREWPLRVLGAALARAGLFLGNDAGVSHLAAAAGAPTLALFGPTDPSTWAPVGPRVLTLRAPNASLANLAVDEVVGAGRSFRSAASGLPSG